MPTMNNAMMNGNLIKRGLGSSLVKEPTNFDYNKWDAASYDPMCYKLVSQSLPGSIAYAEAGDGPTQGSLFIPRPTTFS